MLKRVLVVDDDASLRQTILEILGADMEVTGADSAEQALALIAKSQPEVVLSDVRMPGMGGLSLLQLLHERAPGVDVVLMSAFDDMPTVVTAMREGALDFLPKPLDLHDLRRVLRRIFEDRRLRDRVRAAAEFDAAGYHLNELVGRNPVMIATYKLVGQAAATRTNVLIRGESGTGKELIARAIHFNSTDAGEPFVALNCTALPATLLESELFGHVRGAFTGAHTARRGRFELAGRGTIFLDEIGDTSAEFQAKLLRVLQEREYYPVGAERPERAESRVIAATHRPLEEMIARGEFRADLYYRLRVVEIAVPPLRERRDDIPLIAAHLLRVISRSLHRQPPVLSPDVEQRLAAYDWPGNVRELENALTQAMVRATGDVIHPEHLAMSEVAGVVGNRRVQTLAELERTQVEHVMMLTGGHKTEAARLLGVSRPRLDRLLARHHLT